MSESKICSNCKVSKPLSSFQRHYKINVINKWDRPRSNVECSKCSSCRTSCSVSRRKRLVNKVN